MNKTNSIILSEDQVTEAVAQYLRKSPYNMDFDYVLINDIRMDSNDDFVFDFYLDHDNQGSEENMELNFLES